MTDPNMTMETKTKMAKLVEELIERVGFPIFAFVMMFCVCFYSLEKLTVAITANTSSMSIFIQKQADFQAVVLKDHAFMLQLLSGGKSGATQ